MKCWGCSLAQRLTFLRTHFRTLLPPPLPASLPRSQVLQQYKPATFLSAQQAARAAAAAAGGGSGEQQAPLRALRLDRLLEEVQASFAWISGCRHC